MPEHQTMQHLKPEHVRPSLFDPIRAQMLLQERLGRDTTRAATFGELIDRLRSEKEAMDQEWAEVWDQIAAWKHWKESHRLRRDEVIDEQAAMELKYELIDLAHFLFNSCIAIGMDWPEFRAFYMAKNMENHARQDRRY